MEYRLRSSGGEAAGICAFGVGKASGEAGPAENPVLVFRTTLPIFARMAAGEINPAHAILERKLEVQGDIKTLARFSAMFQS